MYSWPHVAPPWPEERELDVVAPRGMTRANQWWVVGVVVGATALTLATFVAARQPLHRETAFTRFWAPLFEASTPVLLCPGGLDMYELPADVKLAANAAATSPADSPPIEVSPATDPAGRRTLRGRRRRRGDCAHRSALPGAPPALPDPRAHVDLVRGSARVTRGTHWHVFKRMDAPAGVRFPFRGRRSKETAITSASSIASGPTAAWRLPRPWPSLKVSHDYALVSRVVNPATGTLVVTAGRDHSVRDGSGRGVPDEPGASRARTCGCRELVEPQPADRSRDGRDRRCRQRPSGGRHARVVASGRSVPCSHA